MSLKEWLKEEYKQVILAIYSLIMIYVGLFVNIVLMFIIGGIILVCCVIWFVILEYQIRKEGKEEKERNKKTIYKQGL